MRRRNLCSEMAFWLLIASGRTAAAQRPEPPHVMFLRLGGTIDDVEFGRVQNAAVKLQNLAAERNEQALLVLEIAAGGSRFGQVLDLARFLTGPDLSRVKTVAWIPETVIGHNVILALACHEIVMHPAAGLGDVGRGTALDAQQQQDVLELVGGRHNARLWPALAQGLMDPQVEVQRVTVKRNGSSEIEVVTTEGLKRLRDEGAEFTTDRTLKPAQEPWSPTGTEARNAEVLAAATRTSLAEVEDLYELPRGSLREAASDGKAPRAQLIKIDTPIDVTVEQFIKRQIERCLDRGTEVLIFEIESPGGVMVPSLNIAHAIANLNPDRVRTVAYIPRQALSGAAIIALGCDEIYMHRDALMGDAAPIEIKPGQPFERAPEKILSVLVKEMEVLANKKNRPPALAIAMCDKDYEVYRVRHKSGKVSFLSQQEIDEADDLTEGPFPLVTGKDRLLTVDGQQAHELQLAQPPVNDIEDLKQRLGIPPGTPLMPVGPTWVDTLIEWLNTDEAMAILITVGLICLFIELHIMSGVLGIVSAVCFLLFFWSRVMGGTAGWLEVLLFLLGVVCIGLEIFVIPGFGVFGISGAMLVLGSLVLASQTFGNIEPGRDARMLQHTMAYLSGSLVVVIVIAVFLNRYLPHVPLLGRMMLAPPGGVGGPVDGPQLRPELAGGGHPLLGRLGETISALRPAGKVQIGDDYYDVVSEGPYIDAGQRVKIVQVAGNRIVVREV